MVLQQFRKLNATTLKYIAVITMFIDHLTACFLERVQSETGRWTVASASDSLYVLDRIGRAVGRQAFPIFAFFIVEGFFHTHSRWKYLARLSLFAVISEGPFYLLNYTGPIGERLTRSINVYATLALGLIAIWITDVLFTRYMQLPGDADSERETGIGRAGSSGRASCRRRQKATAGGPAESRTIAGGLARNRTIAGGPAESRTIAGRPAENRTIAGRPAESRTTVDKTHEKRTTKESVLRLLLSIAAVAGICWFAWKLNTDYDYIGIITIVIFYLFRQFPLISIPAAWLWMGSNNEYEWWAFPGFLLLLCYNGKRGGAAGHGKGRWNQYFFYLFYPVHLLLLWFVRRMLYGY